MIEPCEQYRSHLEAYVDEELPADQIHDLESHITECECCMAYRAELKNLRDGLNRLTFAQDGPNIAEAIVYSVKRRITVRFVLAASFVLVLKVLDVCGVFGSGIIPRLIVAAGVLSMFYVTGINPFRLVRPEELLESPETHKGAKHASQ